MARNRIYFAMMGACIGMVVVSWTVLRWYSTTAAVVVSVLAMLIPPLAVIVANAGDEASRRQ